MRMKEKTLLARFVPVVMLLLAFSGCSWSDRGALSAPEPSHIDLSDQTLTKFDEELRNTLFQYLAGNPRWEVREEGGLKFAVRQELVEGHYVSQLNGYYNTEDDGEIRQTRVLLAFGRPYGFGTNVGIITRVVPGAKNVPVIVEGEHEGSPGNSSYLIVGGGGLFLEIYDQAPELQRKFTQTAFDQVSAELADVIKYQKEIRQRGVLPLAERYPKPLPQRFQFLVNDGYKT